MADVTQMARNLRAELDAVAQLEANNRQLLSDYSKFDAERKALKARADATETALRDAVAGMDESERKAHSWAGVRTSQQLTIVDPSGRPSTDVVWTPERVRVTHAWLEAHLPGATWQVMAIDNRQLLTVTKFAQEMDILLPSFSSIAALGVADRVVPTISKGKLP